MKLKTDELYIYQDVSTHSTFVYNWRTVMDTVTQILRN